MDLAYKELARRRAAVTVINLSGGKRRTRAQKLDLLKRATLVLGHGNNTDNGPAAGSKTKVKQKPRSQDKLGMPPGEIKGATGKRPRPRRIGMSIDMSWDPTAHPRAAAGAAGGTGGQFVPVGAARDQAAAETQKDAEAQELYKQLQAAKDPAAFMKGLKPEQLGKLTKMLYSFKSSDKNVVAARIQANALLRSQGKDPTDFGYLGGKASATGTARKAAAAKSASASGSVDANKISMKEITRLQKLGWKGDPTDKQERLYSPAELKKRQAAKSAKAHATVKSSMASKGK